MLLSLFPKGLFDGILRKQNLQDEGYHNHFTGWKNSGGNVKCFK